MKKIILTLTIILALGLSANAQIFLQGQAVIPFNSIANSQLFPESNRLDMDMAFAKLDSLGIKTYPKNAGEMAGEFWWIDGMLVQLVSRKLTPTYKADDLSKIRYAMRPEMSNMVGYPKNRTNYDDYFDEVKDINNFEVLIHYYRTKSFEKNFQIQDNQNRYKVFGTVYSLDHQKAHNLIDTLLESITFK
ncbi:MULTISPECIES: hypothetical protein [Sphingobacterium]|uniref:hypothetical protein n=1 Tax=Sphingobacterium TaxID=28453 RepID=UPI0013DAF6A3|nr:MULTISPECIES: hypothetical protein [unclassified Sphingobacterium]